jgi:type IV secretory pathway VirB2 component (pilin)
VSWAAQASLFDAPAEPVAGHAGDWLGGLLGGGLATALCIIAIAMLSMMMLSGRLPVRTGVKVVAGCFLLLGASLAAGGLQGIARNTGDGSVGLGKGPVTVETGPEELLPPADYNPYARAAVRRD